MKRKVSIGAASLLGVLSVGFWCVVQAHPTIEGGIKNGLWFLKGVGGGHFELVADQAANEVRYYISHAEDEPQPGGKAKEWVITLAVQKRKTANGKEVNALPLPDPAGKGEYFAGIAPIEIKDGFAYFWIEVSGKVLLDGKGSPLDLVFTAGKDAQGTHCLKAPIDLSKASTIRFQEVIFKALDPAGQKQPYVKGLPDKAWGIGGMNNNLKANDLPLKKFTDALAKMGEMNKFRKPDAPAAK